MSEEVRTTSASGGQKGSKEERYDLIPTEPLRLLATLYGRGAHKYDDDNWRKGYDWKYSYAALQRHINQFWAGEDIDPEMQVPHVINAAWHCFTLAQFMIDHPEYDHRNKVGSTNSDPEMQPLFDDSSDDEPQHQLIEYPKGEWWVDSRTRDHSYSGMPLDTFLAMNKKKEGVEDV